VAFVPSLAASLLTDSSVQRTLTPYATGRKWRKTVKAVIQDEYGAPETLMLREIERPTIGEKEVLVRIRAAALHRGDCFSVRGSPFPVRLMTGLRRPKYGVPGLDMAGHVEAVGRLVTDFRPGDDVFGSGTGTCAEYTRTSAAAIALKPKELSFEEAAAIPTSALAALHGLRDTARVSSGQRVLIIGASGGVGTYAVQIAKALGAVVSGVCGAGNVEMVRSLGADRVIDYGQEDFTRTGPYDVILDNVEDRLLSDVRRALAPGGTLVLNSGTGAGGVALLIRLLRPLVLSPFVGQRMRRFMSDPRRADLELLARLAAEGRLRPVIERTYPLADTADAIRHLETGHARGKVVVAIA
jgi:NADPH:quinone reductase-like Zn-dependent oxidoreductase